MNRPDAEPRTPLVAMPRSPILLLLPLILLFALGCFPHRPGPRLAHFADRAPAVGEPAPDFELMDLAGRTVKLSDLIGEKPIVLRFGSHSCPVYRYRRFSLEPLIETYRDRVNFLTVYTLEAHPVGSKSPYDDGEWVSLPNRVTGVFVEQPQTADARLEAARFSHDKLELPEPMVVDDMANSVWQAYGEASSPAFVIDRRGRIALRQAWVAPKEIRRVLDELLGAPETLE